MAAVQEEYELMNKDTAMTKQESEEMIQQLKKVFEGCGDTGNGKPQE